MTPTNEGDGYLNLPQAQREAILELGSRGSGGEFDPRAMSELFARGFVSVHSENRRVVLTDLGRQAYTELARNAQP